MLAESIERAIERTRSGGGTLDLGFRVFASEEEANAVAEAISEQTEDDAAVIPIDGLGFVVGLGDADAQTIHTLYQSH